MSALSSTVIFFCVAIAASRVCFALSGIGPNMDLESDVCGASVGKWLFSTIANMQ